MNLTRLSFSGWCKQMISKRIKGARYNLGAPPNWDSSQDGDCGHLWVRVSKHGPGNLLWESAWEPTPEELALLNAGGSVVLSVVGLGQPPVALYVEPAEDEG